MTPSTTSKLFVLYADDDADDRMLIHEAFTMHAPHAEVKLFSDGLDLLRYLKHDYQDKETPCLIILDLNMPVLSGKDCLRLIRQMEDYHNTPVIIFTTSSLTADKYFAEQYKAGFVTKPMVVEEFGVLVNTFLSFCPDEVRS